MIEHDPLIEVAIGAHALDSIKTKTAPENAQATEYDLLVGREQRMTPFKRRQQCLLAPRCQSITRNQQPKTIIKPTAQTLHTQKR